MWISATTTHWLLILTPALSAHLIPWEHGNSDGDTDVDLTDYNTLAVNFVPSGYGAQVVPEPRQSYHVFAGEHWLADDPAACPGKALLNANFFLSHRTERLLSKNRGVSVSTC